MPLALHLAASPLLEKSARNSMRDFSARAVTGASTVSHEAKFEVARRARPNLEPVLHEPFGKYGMKMAL
jgi:hypothetical protein